MDGNPPAPSLGAPTFQLRVASLFNYHQSLKLKEKPGNGFHAVVVSVAGEDGALLATPLPAAQVNDEGCVERRKGVLNRQHRIELATPLLPDCLPRVCRRPRGVRGEGDGGCPAGAWPREGQWPD